MEFAYHCSNTLPKLSWVAIMKKNNDYIDVFHGEWVETNSNFFVEGAWDREFEKGEFDKSSLLMGSGGKIQNNYVVFSTPSHIVERLHIIRKKDKLYISNSLVFVLTMTNEKLDLDYSIYESDFSLGSEYIPLQGNQQLEMYYYCNLLIDKELNINKTLKSNSVKFSTYKEYYDFLLTSLKNISNNAISDKRKIKYDLISTISTGYDSAACSALAAELGCKTVLTFNHPKKYREDSGEEIARLLGYENIIKKSANEYLENNNFGEAEFLSTGELGSSIVMASFEEGIQQKMVLTGYYGDSVWNKNDKRISSSILPTPPIPNSLYEFRFRVGFIYIPLPMFGCTNYKLIHNISNSKEMEKWSLGNDYDRPIPRRIVEEKGVKRELFGFRKNGLGFNYSNSSLRRIKKRMSKKSFKSFKEYYKKNKSIKRLICNYKHIFCYSMFFLITLINFILNKVGIKNIINSNFLPKKYICNPFSPAMLFHWGVSKTSERYKGYNIQSKID
ncbi:hypothetical protein GOQ27_10120 [Clostridium sp. D2Q-11]|uniref:Uncharacterized protein n=1 Tax=Anaeromonas frigoriresistens TaxID=2683708 RepID=A0A942Z7L3_9FIRM|nr:hypothetical protein [Anaeromonas frigoriresistens]MBS4538822.1 hypothetical protein [Anaeromonas frigoriresistens]